MSDIRAHLADALRGHLGWPGTSCCCAHELEGPGGPAERRSRYQDHLVDVLLSLPGIAIVELPEPYIAQDTYTSWRYFDHGEDEYVTFPTSDEEIYLSGIGSYVPYEARALAAVLLAAANAAEAAS